MKGNGVVWLRIALTAVSLLAVAAVVHVAGERRQCRHDDMTLRIGLEDTARRVRETCRNRELIDELNRAGMLGKAREADAKRIADVKGIAATSRIGRNGRVVISPSRIGHDRHMASLPKGRVLSCVCEGYRITAWLPASGTRLADDGPFVALCITAIILLLLLLFSLMPIAGEAMFTSLRSMRVLLTGDQRWPQRQTAAASKRLRRICLHPVTIVCFCAFLVASGISWLVHTHVVRMYASDVLCTTAEDVHDEIMGSINDMLFFIGNAICRHYRTPQAMVGEEGVKQVMSRYDIDEINVVDHRGIVIAGAIAELGYDMGSHPNTAAFNCLLHGVKTYCQPFRSAVEDANVVRKYAGVAFPDAPGYVEIGFDRKRLREDVTYRFETSIRGRHLGETGFFVCADAETGQIDACGHPKFKHGDTLAGIGFDVMHVPQDEKTVFTATLYGERCLCVANVYAYRRMIAAIPLREIYGDRNVNVLATFLILLAVFALVGVFLVRLTDLVARLQGYIATERKRQQQDLSVARTIQTSSLPVVFPERTDYRLFAHMKTAREVGGDFYDFYELPSGRVFFMIADVSGKGVPAAMFMMKAKAIIRASVFENEDLPGAAQLANDRLAENNDAEMFVTVWMGLYDRSSRTVEYVNAGHNPPLVKRADGSVSWVTGRHSLAFAAMAGVRYYAQQITLAPGDSLLLYTDGVTEATNTRGEFFGDACLKATLAGCGELFVGEIRAAVEAFVAGAEQADDITLVALDVKRAQPVVFPCTMEGLDRATAHCQQELENAGCPKADLSKFMIAFDEMASNAVRYSGAKDFQLAVWRARTELAVELTYGGVAWNPLENKDPDTRLSAAERDIGGLGIFMTKKLMDHLEYRRVEGFNVITMRKNVEGAV